jgi:hypothetical protein
MAATAACNLDLDAILNPSGGGDDTMAAAGAVVRRMASDAIEVARIISLGRLGGGGSGGGGGRDPPPARPE